MTGADVVGHQDNLAQTHGHNYSLDRFCRVELMLYTKIHMVQDARQQEEQVTQHRAAVLGMAYTDTSLVKKELFRNILEVAELYKLKIIPLAADEHYIHFGITTTTSRL